MSINQAGKAGILSFVLDGEEIASYINTLQVFESLCKPYLTARAVMIDADMILDRHDIVGGEDVSFTFITEGGGEYSAKLQIFSVKKDSPSKTKRGLAVQVDMLGTEYFGDRTNLVQKGYRNITGTDIIKNIHSEYLGSPLQILQDSMGLLFTQNPYDINSAKPFKAIDDMRRIITFAKYPTGITVYYHDKDSAKLAPVEHLFENVENGPEYIDKSTWGADYMNIASSTNAIIDYTTNADDNVQGRTKISDVIATKKQEDLVLDSDTNKLIKKTIAQMIPDGTVAGIPFGAVAKTILSQIAASRHGGTHNYRRNDTRKIPLPAVRDTTKANHYKAMIGNGPQIYVKVPIQGGLQATVGKGVNLKILPPIGDSQVGASDDSELAGWALCADLTHEIHNDSQLSFTVMRCIKGGYTT